MFRNMRARHSGQQHFTERLVAAASISIAEPVDKITATDASAREPSTMNRPIGYLSSPKRRWKVDEPMWPPSGCCPGRGLGA